MASASPFVCSIDGCPRAFKTWGTLIQHQQRSHSTKTKDKESAGVTIALKKNTVKEFDKRENVYSISADTAALRRLGDRKSVV